MESKIEEGKVYMFDFDISGMCCLKIKAKNKKEAFEKFNKGDFELELNDWDVDFPYNFNPTVNDLMKNCSNKNEVGNK